MKSGGMREIGCGHHRQAAHPSDLAEQHGWDASGRFNRRLSYPDIGVI
jgi:hypothetical protein